MPEIVQSAENPGTSERRLHPRKQLWFPQIQLGGDNGGVVLDISESGLGMQPVRSLVDGQLPRMRFQLSESQAWIETQGRIAWISPSKKRAGVEFVGLPEKARNQIRQWIPVALHPDGSVEANPPDEQMEPAKDTLHSRELESVSFVPEPETKGHVLVDQSQRVVTGDPVVVLPSATESRSAEAVSERSAAETTRPVTTERAGYRTASPVALSYGKKHSREIGGRGRTASSSKSGRRIGVLVVATLLVSVFIDLAFHLRTTASNRQARELAVTATKPELSPTGSSSPTKASVDLNLPMDSSGFVLQVGAMKHEENADLLVASLRKKNFPAFSYQRGADDFYRVAVGPYHDADSAAKVKEELKKQNFDAIRMQWNP